MLNTIFEKETCERCGGSGQYSYTQMEGTRCRGCGGKGEHLTKRGIVARRYYDSLRSLPALDILPGMVVFVRPVPMVNTGGWWTVVAMEEGSPYINREGATVFPVTLTYKNGYAESGVHEPLLVKWTEEQEEEYRQEALRYQSTLTKEGKGGGRRG